MVIGVALECYSQLHADDRGKGAHAFQVDLVPDGAYFLRVEGRGIKAMLTGVLITLLGAAFLFRFTIVLQCAIIHDKSRIAGAAKSGNRVLSP